MGHYHRSARVPGQILFQPFKGLDVEVVGWLVQQQNVGVARDDARKAGPRLLSSTEDGERGVFRERSKTQPVEHRVCTLFDLVASQQREIVGRSAVLFDQGAQLRTGSLSHALLNPEQRIMRPGVLGKAATYRLAKCLGRVDLEPLRQPGGRCAGAQDNAPGVGLLYARDDSHQRRLAGPVRTDQADVFPAIDYERDVFQDDFGAIAFGDVYDLEHPRPFVATQSGQVAGKDRKVGREANALGAF